MANINTVGQAILDMTKQKLGALWDQLTDADRELINECSLDAANLQVEAMAVSGNAAAVAALAGEQRQIDAQFANIAAGNAEAVRTAFWQTVQSVAQVALSVALKAV